MTRGRYSQAWAAATNLVAKETRSIRLRWSAREAFLANGQAVAAEEMTTAIEP